MIVRDTAGQLFFVVEFKNPNLQHCWLGFPVKKVGDTYQPKGKAKERMIRKAGCSIVKEG